MTEDMQGPQEGGDTSSFSSTDAPGSVLRNLRQLPVFGALTDEEFRTVAGLLRSQHVPRGLLIIEQGAANHRLFVIRRGLSTADSQERIQFWF